MLRVYTANRVYVCTTGEFALSLQRCRVPTVYRVHSAKADGTPMLRRKSVYICVRPWRYKDLIGANVYVCGECALADLLTSALNAELCAAVSGYSVEHLTRPIGEMKLDVHDFDRKRMQLHQ